MNKNLRLSCNSLLILGGIIGIKMSFKYTYNKSSVLEYISLNFSFILLCIFLGFIFHIVILAIAENIKLFKNIPLTKYTKIDDNAFSLIFITWTVFPLFLLLGHFDEKFFSIIGIPVAVSLSLFSSYKKFFKWINERRDILVEKGEKSSKQEIPSKKNTRRKRTKPVNRKHYKRLKS